MTRMWTDGAEQVQFLTPKSIVLGKVNPRYDVDRPILERVRLSGNGEPKVVELRDRVMGGVTVWVIVPGSNGCVVSAAYRNYSNRIVGRRAVRAYVQKAIHKGMVASTELVGRAFPGW